MAKGNDLTLNDLIVDAARDIPPGSLEVFCLSLESADRVTPAGQIIAQSSITNPASIKSLRTLVERWQEEIEEAGFPALAWALRAAGATDSRWREESALDLVWTGPVPVAGKMRKTRAVLQSLIDCAEQNLWLICFAAYKIPLIVNALEAAIDRGVILRIIHEDPDVSDNKVKFSAMSTLGKRVAEAAELYVWPLDQRQSTENGDTGTLHAKAVLADDKRLFVSSANLTSHALDINMELGVLIRGGQRPKWMAEHIQWLLDSKTLRRVN